MQQSKQTSAAAAEKTTITSTFSMRQRLLSATVLLGMTGSTAIGAARANTAPTFATLHNAHGASGQTSPWTAAAHTSSSGQTAASFATSGVMHAVGQTFASNIAAGTNHNHAALNTWAAGITSTFATPSTAPQATNNLDLSSTTASFKAGSLAGFHTITIDVGGKQEQINFNTTLTAAELVAAQQVLATGSQQLTINASGAATGGSFNLSSSSVKALDTVLGGNIGSLYISKGVEAIDSLSSLTLLGSLTNMGTILVGAPVGASNQKVDVISASNIYNAAGGSITSGSILGVLMPTDITLNATTTFLNSGIIHSSGNLNITGASISNLGSSVSGKVVAPVISAVQNVNLNSNLVNNTGTVSSSNANINVGGANVNNLTVLNSTGNLTATNGNVNFAVAGKTNSNTITVSGGNLNSKYVDFEAGKGAVQVNVNQLTGVVEGEACSAHVTANTKSLNLGQLDVSGDPTYYNTGGDIVIGSGFTATGGADLALVASGNIIGNGGALDTSSTTGNAGSLTLIAGANFTVTPSPSGSGTQGPDTKSTITVSNSTLATKGSKTGGYIDLSGVTLTGVSTNAAVTKIDASSTNGAGGSITMAAYKGSGKNSGSIVDTATASQVGGATTIVNTGTTDTGTVTIIAPGTINGGSIDAHGVVSTPGNGVVQIFNGTPIIGAGTASDSITIQNGLITLGHFNTQFAAPTGTSISQTAIDGMAGVQINTAGTANVQTISSSGSVTIAAATAGTNAAPVDVELSSTATLSLASKSTKAAFYIASTNSSINLGQSALPTGSLLSVKSGGDINVNGAVSATTITLQSASGSDITSSINGSVTGKTATLNASNGGSINVPVAADNLALNATNLASSTVTLLPSAAKATTLLASTVDDSIISLVSEQPLKVANALSALNANATISYNPTTAPTKAINGLAITAPINFANGTLTLSTIYNTATLTTSGKGALNGGDLYLTWSGAQGTKSAPIIANTTSSINSGSNTSIYIKQAGAGVVNANDANTTTTDTIGITGTGASLSIGNISAPNISIINSNTAGQVAFAVNASVTGSTIGTITITAPGGITAASTSLVNGHIINVTSTAGDIGTNTASLNLNSIGAEANSSVTLTAAKGSVYISNINPMNLNKSTALNTFSLSSIDDVIVKGAIAGTDISLATSAGNLSLGASVGGTKTNTVTLTATGGDIDVTAKNVVITGASLDATAGFSIQSNVTGVAGLSTKVASLTESTGGAGFAAIYNTGALTIAGSSGSSARISATGAITTAATIDFSNFGDLTLTSPVAINFNNGASLKAYQLFLNAPSVVVNTNATISAIDTTSVASSKGLSVTGGGTFDPGSSLSLSGTSITLGSASAPQNPFILDGTKTLASLAVETKGNFTLDFAQPIIVKATNSGFGILNIQAANIVSVTPTPLAPLSLTATDTTGNNQIQTQLILTGTTPVTLGSAAGQFELAATGGTKGLNDGFITVHTAAPLIIGFNALGFQDGSGTVSLTGKTVTMTDKLTTGNFASLTLEATGGILDVSKDITIASSGNLFLTASTSVNIDSTATVQAHTFTITGPASANNGIIEGLGSSVLLQYIGPASATGSIAISKTQTGQYNNIYDATFDVLGNGTINTGNLFTSSSSMQDTLTYLSFTAPGTGGLTINSNKISTLVGGGISIFSKNVTFGTGVTALGLNVNGGNLSINLNAPITFGTTKGSIDVQGTVRVFFASALGNLTINEPITATANINQVQANAPVSPGGSILDASGAIIINAPVTFQNGSANAQVTVTTDGTAKTSTVVNSVANPIIADNLTIGQTSSMISSAPTQTKAAVTYLQGGALNINNVYSGGDAFVRRTGDTSLPITALSYTNTSANSTQRLIFTDVVVTNGNLNVKESVGGLTIAGISGGPHTLQTLNGNITLQDDGPFLAIVEGMSILASSTKAGVGNVTIAVGPIPTSNTVGTAPAVNTPTINIESPGQVYWNTGTVDYVGSNNTVNANGRNVIFSPGSGTITIGQINGGSGGGTTITADPPVTTQSSNNNSGGIHTHAMMARSSGSDAQSATTGATTTSASINAAGEETITASSTPLTSTALTTQNTVGINGLPASNFAAGNATILATVGEELTGSATLNSDANWAGVGLLPGVKRTSNKAYEGATLLSPDHDTTFETALGTISVAKNSVALILAFDGGVAVYNLHDTRNGAVQIRQANGTTTVTPGKTLVLTSRNVKCFEQINPVPTVAYRSMRSNTLANGLTSFEAEFNHTSLLQGIKPLRDFVGSTDRHNAKAAQSMLKTAVILSQYAGRAPYQYMVAPALTASLPH